VSTQTVLEFHPGQLSQRTIDTNSYFVPGSVIPISDAPAYSKTESFESEEYDADGLGCFRGVRSALLFEFGAFVFAYAAWHLWHFVAQ
jgi:hypothetical protein